MEYIGFIAAFLTTVSFVPQAIMVIKTKDTKGISLGMYSLFVAGVFLWVVYGYVIQDMALLIANIVTFGFASIVLAYKIKYK